MNKKNGKIELFRFLFCVCIVFFHLNKNLFNNQFYINDTFSFFSKGNMAVEFFFILSGALLAKTAFKEDAPDIPLGSQTVSFMKKKLLPLIAPHTIAFFLTFAVMCVHDKLNGAEVFPTFLSALPSLFFMHKVGFDLYSVNAAEWYIGCMLFAMLFIFPLCRKYKTIFTNIIAPTAAIIIIGYLFKKYGGIGGVSEWDGLTYKCTLRAIAEISLGTTAFSISKKLGELNFSIADRAFLTILEVLCFIFVFYVIVSKEESQYTALVIIAVFAGITLIFSDKTFGKKIFDNRFCYYLGRLSLPVYLIHTFARKFIRLCYPKIYVNPVFAIVVIFAFSMVCSIILMYLSVPVEKLIQKKLNKISLPKEEI